MTTLLELAERVEALDGPDGEVEKQIAIAVGWKFHVEQHENDMRDDVWTDPDGREHAWYPFVTRSLDAAMTLVPEGCIVCLVNAGTEERKPDFTRASALVGPPDDPDNGLVTAATMPLALCAAALRARANNQTAERGS